MHARVPAALALATLALAAFAPAAQAGTVADALVFTAAVVFDTTGVAICNGQIVDDQCTITPLCPGNVCLKQAYCDYVVPLGTSGTKCEEPPQDGEDAGQNP